MEHKELPRGTSREALFDTFVINIVSLLTIVSGVESTHNNFASPAFGLIALGGLLSVAGGIRWHDYHEIREHTKIN